ncbi:hypothetical protein JQV27_02125 [Sulfitobacter mediterraneus]|uniref:hypothetical protein n=1 Tax=Sulfitobacter mediterraneus TaxID=83219 RepID=UPI00193277CE|nr:hypothetical protein [Sulfitobacter mediterraneus]MBM1631618.1 hypothetical protein [Sulfitobacter mediterraneus]MBM1639433.1 hypothetical protein [Sulfitobacter mediterraneus]MBM1643482.1 hypothetical protein [Sulfitobacter mediterraneus]MBM1647528.1 hypothetical protein [Sulfitobacter mediterraneus]MBM1651573.1 hypothetical protein [Sulfitobacter mediterraneus]
MPAQSAKRLGQFAAITVIGFGLITALGSNPATNALPNVLVDLLHWPFNGLEQVDTPAARVIAAIAGGVMVGWGINLLLITNHLFDTNNRLWCLLVFPGLACWYVVDSTGSVLSGAWLNAWLNLSFLVMFGAAYWMRSRAVDRAQTV